MKVDVKKVVNYSFLPTTLLIIIALGLYSLIQRYRYFHVATTLTKFDAMQNLKDKITLMEKKYKLALKKPGLYQQLYMINIIVLLLVVGIAVYYFLDWDLLIYALFDIFTI